MKGLWDDEDGFFYDQIRFPDDGSIKMKVSSIVGLIPLFATEVLDEADIADSPIFKERMKWFAEKRPDLASLVSRWNEKSSTGSISSAFAWLPDEILLKYMLDEKEFLSDYGIRSLSKYHLDHPYKVAVNGAEFGIAYIPGESDSGLFGGNSNWRGPYLDAY
jgi:hypothetical protein